MEGFLKNCMLIVETNERAIIFGKNCVGLDSINIYCFVFIESQKQAVYRRSNLPLGNFV